MHLKIENVENELDIRVESLIIEIEKYRDDYRKQLDGFKINFQKYVRKIIF